MITPTGTLNGTGRRKDALLLSTRGSTNAPVALGCTPGQTVCVTIRERPIILLIVPNKPTQSSAISSRAVDKVSVSAGPYVVLAGGDLPLLLIVKRRLFPIPGNLWSFYCHYSKAFNRIREGLQSKIVDIAGVGSEDSLRGVRLPSPIKLPLSSADMS